MTKCGGKDCHGEPCRNNTQEDISFCKYHDYMKNYTEDMMNNLKFCSNCRKYYYIAEGKQCSKCKERGTKIREKQGEEKIICEKEGCKFERTKENEFCGKHQTDYFKKETEKSGKKVCGNYIRGCRNILEKTYERTRCEDCLKKERASEKKRRENINNTNKEEDKKFKEIGLDDDEIKIVKGFLQDQPKKIIIDEISSEENDDNSVSSEEDHKKNIEIVCIKCNKKSSRNNFLDKRDNLTKKCNICREKARLIDLRRKSKID